MLSFFPVTSVIPTLSYTFNVFLGILPYFINNYYIGNLIVFNRGVAPAPALTQILEAVIFCRLIPINNPISETAVELFKEMGMPPFFQNIAFLLPKDGRIIVGGYTLLTFQLTLADQQRIGVFITNNLSNALLTWSNWFRSNGYNVTFEKLDLKSEPSRTFEYNVAAIAAPQITFGDNAPDNQIPFFPSAFGFVKNYAWLTFLLFALSMPADFQNYCNREGMQFNSGNALVPATWTSMLNVALDWYFGGNTIVSRRPANTYVAAPAGQPPAPIPASGHQPPVPPAPSGSGNSPQPDRNYDQGMLPPPIRGKSNPNKGGNLNRQRGPKPPSALNGFSTKKLPPYVNRSSTFYKNGAL